MPSSPARPPRKALQKIGLGQTSSPPAPIYAAESNDKAPRRPGQARLGFAATKGTGRAETCPHPSSELCEAASG